MSITKKDFSVDVFPDGSVCLNCGEGPSGRSQMERDLMFSSGAMNGDPDLVKQREIIDYIMEAIKNHDH